MKGIKLTDNISYIPMEDEQGKLGLLVLKETSDNLRKVVSVENQSEFTQRYNELRQIEGSLSK